MTGARHQSSWLDLAPAFLGTATLIIAVAARLQLWQVVAELLPQAPDAFTSAFLAFAARERRLVMPLGALTGIAVIATLLRHGLSSGRSKMRLTALALLLASSVLRTAVMDPIEEAIAAGGGLQATSLSLLAAQWSGWYGVHLALAAIMVIALVGAHRLPAATAREDSADAMSPQNRVLLLLLGAATLFEGYDRFIVSLALPYIGSDLGASEGKLGYALSLIRIGALLSMIPGRLADRFGRRRVLLVTILAYTLATAATGLSRGLTAFVVFQLIATVFLTAELALAQVVIAEEFPAHLRGRGQGLLGAFAALGAGVAAMLFPLMQETVLGWRGLYFVGVLPLVLIAYLRRRLPETERWRALESRQAGTHARLFEVLQPHLRSRFVILNLTAGAATFVAGPAFGFASYHATHAFGWTPGQVSTMMITGGGLGLSGWFLFGRLADTVGRRPVGVVTLLGGVLSVVAYYRTPWLLPSFAALVFMEAGVSVAVNSLGTELFPTRLRATAKAWITNAGIVGAMLGLLIVGAAADRVGGVGVIIPLLTIPPAVCAPLLFLLRETSGEELESIEPG